jgi:hypothetical protein
MVIVSRFDETRQEIRNPGFGYQFRYRYQIANANSMDRVTWWDMSLAELKW